MKKIIFSFMLAVLCGAVYAQQVVVAVFPFEARSGTSADDANTVTEVFNIKLQATGALRTVGRNVIDNVIKQEHIYQMSDISDDEKTAQLKKGLNADWVVYGVVTRLGRTFVITATLIDLNTNETMGGAPMQMDSIEEAFEKMDAPIADMIQRLTGGSGGRINPVSAASSGPSKDAVLHFERGITFFERDDFDMALAEFSEVIRIDESYAKAYAWRGRTYAAKGDNDAGITDANQAIRLDLNDALAYLARGYAYYHKGDNDRAIADYNQAIRLDPNNALAYRYRGHAYLEKKDYDRAIADYNQAIRLDPNNAIAYYNRGLAYYVKGDNDRAIADYTQAIRLDPNDASAYNNRGLAYYNKGDYDRAIADYNQALRINPNNALTYNNRGNAYYNKRDYDRAIADYNQALRIDPNDAAAKNNLEIARKARGR